MSMVEKKISGQPTLDALGNPTRREILEMLKASPMAVGAIADKLPISRPAVSKHLRQLLACGLVEYASEGRSHVFRLRPAGFLQARAYLESFWDEALENFARTVEDRGEAKG